VFKNSYKYKNSTRPSRGVMLERVRRAPQLPSCLFLGSRRSRTALLQRNLSNVLDKGAGLRMKSSGTSFDVIEYVTHDQIPLNGAPAAALLTGAPLGISDEGFFV
jgi:hypothetical protein